MGKIKRLFPYIFLFIIFILWILFILPMDLDGVWSYGFSHNIYKGIIPYKGFNMVITPLYPFLMSLPFYLFKSSFLVLSISHVLLLLIIIYFLFKLLDDKAWLIILLFVLFPHFFPNYNWLLFLEYIILLYLEKEDKDFYIGLILAFMVLTKQSVGICMLLPSLIYIKNKEKIFNRLKGFILPIVLFIIYLLLTNSLYNFYDLCIAGLFDFAGSNGNIFNINILFMIIFVVITIHFIIRDKQDIRNYYALAFFSIMLPLFDIYHFRYCWYVMAIMLLLNIKKIPDISYKWISILSISGITLFSLISIIQTQEIVYPNNIKHFEYKRMTKTNLDITNKVNKYIKENSDKEIIFLNSNAYYFKIINDLEIGYLDLTNMGNWGYNGSNKLLKEVKKYKNTYFFINKNELNKKYQTDKNVLKYVIKKGKKIKSIWIYDVYFIN